MPTVGDGRGASVSCDAPRIAIWQPFIFLARFFPCDAGPPVRGERHMRVPTSVAMLLVLAAAAPLAAQSAERVSNDSAQVSLTTTQPAPERETATAVSTSGASVTGLRAGV